MDKTKMVALLGKPLTTVEDTNFALYLNISIQTLEQMTCLILTETSGDDGVRVYDTREGYRTQFIDLFTELSEVKINDDIIGISDYSKRQWNRRTADWYNSLVFEDAFSETQTEVTVTGTWLTTDNMPDDLQAVLAGLFGLVASKQKYDPTVASKQVEDFRLTLRADADLDADFSRKFSTTLAKYNMCNIPNVQHSDGGC